MRYLKIFEEFTGFHLDEISKEEYYEQLNKPRVGIPEQMVLEFRKNLPTEYLGKARGRTSKMADKEGNVIKRIYN